MKLSVIVVNWKVRELLNECLRSVYARVPLGPDQWQLIVVDNDSRDGTPEMMRAEFPGAQLIVNARNLGFGAANNQAFEKCEGEYVLLLNPDTVLLDGALAGMLELLDGAPGAAAVGCRLLDPDGTFQRFTAGNPPGLRNMASYYLFGRVLPRWLQPPPLFIMEEPPSDQDVGWVSGACLLLRRAAAGGRLFDERFFMYGEDIELCQRLTSGGWRVVYTPRFGIVHYGGRSLDLQTPEVQMSRLRGLRQVFEMRHGKAAQFFFDAEAAAAFLLRTVAFGLATCMRPGRGFERRLEDNRQLMRTAWRTLVGSGGAGRA